LGGLWKAVGAWLMVVMLVSVASATELAPSVQLRPIKDEAKVGEACIFEASIVNPISPNGKNMTAQIILKVPPNVVVFGESFTKSGSGQYVAIFKNVPPGDAVHQRVYVKGLKAGEYIISADLVWYWEDEQTPHINSLDYNVRFTEAQPTPTPEPEYIIIICIAAIVIIVIAFIRIFK
jgi:hypothetical protein